MRQLIVNLKAEYPGFTPHEIATICFLHFERRPSDHTVKRILADARFARARSWEEMIATHRTWMRDYNMQRHWAHGKREDGCHSPAAVLGEQKGTVYPESVRNRILFATRFTRQLARHGFLRFQKVQTSRHARQQSNTDQQISFRNR